MPDNLGESYMELMASGVDTDKPGMEKGVDDLVVGFFRGFEPGFN